MAKPQEYLDKIDRAAVAFRAWLDGPDPMIERGETEIIRRMCDNTSVAARFAIADGLDADPNESAWNCPIAYDVYRRELDLP